MPENEPGDVTQWLNQARDADQAAFHQLWDRYFTVLSGFARNRIAKGNRREYDEEDAALSAFNSFFRGIKEDRFPILDDRDDLWKVLVTIATRKIRARRRKQSARKRSEVGTVGESDLSGGDGDEAVRLDQVFAERPTEEYLATMRLDLDTLLGKNDDPVIGQMIVMKLEGFTNEEIAKELSCSTRHVERKMADARQVLASLAEE